MANTWSEVTPCNFHLRALAEKVKEGIRAAGGTPIEFNTIVISDGITMGTEGMKGSLDFARSDRGFDRAFRPLARLRRGGRNLRLRQNNSRHRDGSRPAQSPCLSLYGGSIMPGQFHGRDVTIQDVFEAPGAFAAGKMTEKEVCELENQACPGAGACGGQFTANTMATAITFLGISPMGANEVPAVDPRKAQVAFDCGKLVMELLKGRHSPQANHHAMRHCKTR